MVLSVIGGFFIGATFVPWPSDQPTPGLNEIQVTKESGLCTGKSILLERRASLKEEIAVRTDTENDNSWTDASLFLQVGGAFTGRCNAWGDYLGLRHLTVALYAQDDTMPFRADDVWIAPRDVTHVVDGVATPLYHIETRADSLEPVGPDGRRLFASFDLEWKPSKRNSVNFTFHLTVFDVLAEPHIGDVLRFTAVLTMTVGETMCAGLCWSPSADWTTESPALETTIRG